MSSSPRVAPAGTRPAAVLAAAVSVFSIASPGYAQAVSAAKDSPAILPLQAARTLDLHATRGSWISLDVSPDGQTIVFDLLGDLYVLPISGGDARQLTSGMAYDAQPRFSPDGREVVFVSDRSGGENLWIVSSDGSGTRQVTRGEDARYTSPEWTPDGQYLIASTAEDLASAAVPHIYYANGGTGGTLLGAPALGPSPPKLLGAAFGADARKVWFSQRQDHAQLGAFQPHYQLTVYDRTSGRLVPMSARYGGSFRPALSRDGKWLAYGTRHEEHTGLRVRNLHTGSERWLAHPIQRDAQETSRPTMDVLPGYSFTPDSRAVVLSYGGEIWRVPIDGGAPAKIPFALRTRLALGPEVHFSHRIDDAPEFTVTQIRDAVPSPDGRRLAFTALNELYVMNWPDGVPQRLAAGVKGGKFHPTWSPDGRALAFVSWEDREGGYVWRTSADGRGEPRRLTDLSGYYQQTAWSPAGDRIVALRAHARALQEGVSFGTYYSGPGLGAEFVWVPATGGAPKPIAPADDRSHPHFTAQGDRIYAYSPSEGLVSFRWDGSDRRAHLKMNAPPRGGWVMWEGFAPVEFMLMSPDGRHALAQVASHIYVMSVPVVGGTTPVVSLEDPEKAEFPARRLTQVGGQFPVWSADGKQVHWSLGNAHSTLALDRVDPLSAPSEQRIRIRTSRDLPEGTAVLRGGRVITMRGEEIIEDADLLIRNHRIEAIGPRGQLKVPHGARVLEISGKTVVPGFVDTHYHARLAHGRRIPPIHSSDVWQFPINVAYGVTTTRDPSGGGGTTDLLTYKDRVETGQLLGPRIYSTGPPVFQFEGIGSLEHAREVLRRYSEYYDTKTIKIYLAGNRQQRQWLVMAARDLKLTPTVEGGGDYKLNLTQVIDGYAGLEHTLPVFPVYGDVLNLFRASGITYSPTLLINYGGVRAEDWFFATENVHDDPKLRRFTPHADIDSKARRRSPDASIGWAMRHEYVFDEYAQFARDLIRAGGKVGVGSHTQLHGLGYHWEIWALQSGGMSPHEALRAASFFGASAIGFEQDLGSIEPGKLADLVVLDGDPLQDIRNTRTIRYVMKNGRLYEGDTLNEIYPRERPFERRYYWAEEPQTPAGIRP